MKAISNLSLKLWLPVLVFVSFLILGAIMIWKEFRAFEDGLIASSMQFVRQDMASLQREMEKDIGGGYLNYAAQALSSRGVNIRYKVLVATDDKGVIQHSIQLSWIDKKVETLPGFDAQRYIKLQTDNRAKLFFNKERMQITAYFPLALARNPNEIRPSRTGMLFLLCDLSDEQAQIWNHVLQSSVPVGGGLLIFMVVLFAFLNFFVTRPIQSFVQAADALAKGENESRVDIRGGGEFALLGHVFNDMVVQLNRRFEQRLEAEKATHEQQQLVRDLLESTAEAIYGVDTQGNCTFANPSCVRMLGYESVDDLLGQNMSQLVHRSQFENAPDPKEKMLVNSTLEGIKATHSDSQVLWRADGSSFPAEYWSYPIIRDEHVIGAVVSFLDLTARKEAESEILKLSMAVEQSPVSVTITDIHANLEYVNCTFEKVTGYSREEVIGKNVRMLRSGTTPEEVYEKLWAAIETGESWTGILKSRKKNGEAFWEHVNIAPVVDEFGEIRHYLAVKEDITLRKQQEEKILHQAYYDSLTDLPNRYLALDRLSQLINDNRRNNTLLAVLFLDLDDFKKVNDSLGHETGDKLLVEAAGRLKNHLRAGDTVARLGGDEFVILLGGLTEASDASPVVENILSQISRAFKIEGRELILTSSIGVAVFPGDGENPSELLRHADSAMYHAKALGRNTYSYFTESMNRDVSRRLLLEEQIHGALERGEFEVLYQPQINIKNNEIIGAEALLRWNNEVLGSVSPGEFIPVAEQSGVIVSIGQFVLREALDMVARWQRVDNTPYRIAVNLSPRQFRDPALVTDIKKAIRDAKVSAQNLELEITEGVLMSGHSHIDEALQQLSNFGVSIAMDDFGTGYSSLSYLRSYPFNVLKVDQSFVRDITIDPGDRELINASITMAHGLGLEVIAEGVETEGQLDILKNMDCDVAQGYFFSKPVSELSLLHLTEHGAGKGVGVS